MDLKLYLYKYVRFQEFEAMNANQDVAKTIDFEKISVNSVEPQTSDGKSGVIFKVQNGLGITNTDQPLFEHVKP